MYPDLTPASSAKMEDTLATQPENPDLPSWKEYPTHSWHSCAALFPQARHSADKNEVHSVP